MLDAASAPAAVRRSRRLDPSAGVWLGAAALLLFLVAVPLVWIFVASVHADTGNRLTLANYVEAFTRAIYLTPIRNSLVVAGCTSEPRSILLRLSASSLRNSTYFPNKAQKAIKLKDAV